MTSKKIEDKWTNEAAELLLGRQIESVRYMTEEEQEMMGWYSRSIIIQLDNGLLIFPSRDDEGNDAGALFTSSEAMPTIPVI